MTETLLIRTDGSSQIGTGHVMRCLSLAQAWSKADGNVHFVGAKIPNGLTDRIDQWTTRVHRLNSPRGSQCDATRTTDIANEYDASWIVVDGPHFDADYLSELTVGPARVLLIDDMGKRVHYGTDIVLNQNLHAHEDMYANRYSDTELLLGSDYVLFRDEFLEWIDWSPDPEVKPRTLLVTLGGSDPNNHTKTVLNALDQVEADLETVVIVGALNDSLPELTDLAEEVNQSIQLKQNVSDMAAQMAWADIAVSSGGTTCWELAFMGVPTVVGTIAPIEEYTMTGLRQTKLFSPVGNFEDIAESEIGNEITRLISDTDYRTRMSNRGQEIVDGYGRQRTIETMRNF
ncbi:UDP-2,4-diacetamido-2,4,6-trideoxy-beta-L-altropyranose hydrolase [Halobacterium bonnevillei]|uniref:UDP-2,4-diacetamido-2,4, 6-trideoxy-beta-L-altropyranose hydrolase n=1 Tax=Halobacterium bonnevillei TaxID=2692200 RepID=A0A6B0SDU1_9EURY|nr:UDP-2,4-diacetamido-2,4,6-trideoxy-beta-L-altropyranose hydrolase [Halobacterium bonnevillei]MXR19077.1 UDP-2,4-diacetamido-2,4,6-trideoxy-beta-L-altropyranose hydrolase [Halobacterium bonnevillei]